MLYWPFAAGVSVGPNWWRRGGPRSRGFASARSGGRIHAACDLCVPRGTDIRAICDGEVLFARYFYGRTLRLPHGTWQLVVLHSGCGMNPFIVRYGEILAPGDGGISHARGTPVTAGNVIAKVGQLDGGGSMLHLEVYASSDESPSLSIAGRWNTATLTPATYTAADREAIRRGGWHWRFQRRLDLADPTDFLLALRDGRTPAQPARLLTVGTHCCTWCSGVAAGGGVSTYGVGDFEEEVISGRNRFLERMSHRTVRRHGMHFRVRTPLGLNQISSPREAARAEVARSISRTATVSY